MRQCGGMQSMGLGERYHVSNVKGQHHGNTCTCILELWKYERIWGVQMKCFWGIIATNYCFWIKEWNALFGEHKKLWLWLHNDVEVVKPRMNWSPTNMIININCKLCMEIYFMTFTWNLASLHVVLHYFIILTTSVYFITLYSYAIHKWMAMKTSKHVTTLWSWCQHRNLCYTHCMCMKPNQPRSRLQGI